MNEALMTKAINHLLLAAVVVVKEGVPYARTDDPHNLATLKQQFDGGLARHELAIEYLTNTQRRVSLRLHGTQADEPFSVEVFGFVVDDQHPLGGATLQ